MTEPLQPPQPEGEAPLPVASDATQQLPIGDFAAAEATTRIPVQPPVVVPPSLQLVPPRSQGAQRPRARMGWALGAAVLLLGAAAVFFYLRSQPAPAGSAPAAAQEPVPPGVQVYVDRANAGDPRAMRMLGVMYYYGLNVRQDRDKGLAWYRRAAEQGDPAAREDLAKLQPAGNAK